MSGAAQPETPTHAFGNGLFAGLAGAAVLVHAWFAVLLAPLRGTYADLLGSDSSIQIPALTSLVVHPAWLWGVPLVGLGAVVALIARRPARRALYVACALVLLATATSTWTLSQLPLRMLADGIKSDEPVTLTPVGP